MGPITAPLMIEQPQVLTTGQLAAYLAVNRHLLTRWCDAGELKCYRLPGRDQRRIELADALDFALRHRLPAGPLEALAEKYGIFPLRCPTVLLISPTVERWLPFWGGIFEAVPAPSSLRAGLILARRSFQSTVIDSDLGTAEIRELLLLFRERCPDTFVGVLAAEDDGKPRLWRGLGAHMVWPKPCDLAQVANELWTLLAARRTPPSAPSAPPAPRGKRAA
jgi:excisionase family DNA binding protein